MRVALAAGLALLALLISPDAHAQFSPGGIFSVLTSPLRGTLQGFGRAFRPRHHAPRRSLARRAPAPSKTTPAIATAATTAAATPAVAAVATPVAAPADDPAKTTSPKPFWPGAHEDLIGYTFWPQDYDDRLWTHGFGEIVTAAFASVPKGSAPASGSPSAGAKLCPPDMDRADGPAGKIVDFVQQNVGPSALNDTQNAALSDLQTAILAAMKTIRSACADVAEADPAARMQRMLDRLWATRVAGYLVREPLAKFYGTLNAAQKAKLERASSGPDIFGLCSAASQSPIPMPQIERVIRPDAEQRKALGNLQQRMDQAALSLRASCPGKPPVTPMARLDAALDRIDAITYAAGNLAQAFGDFYAGLNDEQRTRLAQLAR